VIKRDAIDEADLIAARLAAASACFPLPHSDVDGKAVRASAVFVEATGNVINVCVTDHDGAVREYSAAVQLVAQKDAPGRCANTAEGDSNDPTTK
jgi:hypothetical protein